MCFSATASFVTAGITGVIGVVALARTNAPHERLLAATPLFFGVQQGVEGLLWLTLPISPDGSVSTLLTQLFLFFAESFWPVYAPLAVLLIEPSKPRRRLMALCVLVGLGVAGYFLWSILMHAHAARILDGHIVYVTENKVSQPVGAAYMVATGFAVALSSYRMVVMLAAIVLVGSATAYVLYWEAFVSVWCFFAAAASVVVLFHFEQVHRRRPEAPGVETGSHSV
jgi:hypothetical protein